MEGEFRQPLLQGAGVDFNRIAGPDGRPGAMNGVLLARINSDIGVTDFEIARPGIWSAMSRMPIGNCTFAYRYLDSKIAARDRALETWRSINALFVTNRRGGEAEKEAQAREQYFRFEEEVQNALAGRPIYNETKDFRGDGGVQTKERRLRRIMGIAPTDGRLIRPAQEPTMARVVFDWDELLVEALNRRAELRRQKWKVKRRRAGVGRQSQLPLTPR